MDRSCWIVERWFEMVERAFTDKEWYDNFWVSKETFGYIVSEIENEIARKDTRMHKAILRYHDPPSWIACRTKARLDGHVIISRVALQGF